MKTLKYMLINMLTLVLGLGVMSGYIYQRHAEAARIDTVPALKITGLGNKMGQYLNVIYAVGSEPFISTAQDQVNISHVKSLDTLRITADTMMVPSIQVVKEGFFPSYNMVVLVVSPQPNYSWQDADGSSPQGMTTSTNHVATLVHPIPRSDLETNAVTAPGASAPVFAVDLSK